MKKFLLLTLMIPVVFCAGCTTKEETPPETPETPETLEYFDFTVEEFVDDLAKFSIDLKVIPETEGKLTDYALYTSETDKNINYIIRFDSVTKKVYQIFCGVAKPSTDEAYNALERYYYNVLVVAQTIDSDVYKEDILAPILSTEVSDETESTSSYSGENFHFITKNSEQSFNGLFSPPINT